MNMLRRTFLCLLLLLAPPGLALIGPDVIDWALYPRRFAVVEEGALYRGGEPSADHVRRLKREKGVRTILSLTSHEDDPETLAMESEIRALGLRHIRVPMPGNGCGEFEALDRAADALADQGNHPVFFHCAAGKQRSNAALAAFQLKHEGWSLERVLSELQSEYDLDTVEEKVLVDHITAYARRLDEAGRAPSHDQGDGDEGAPPDR